MKLYSYQQNVIDAINSDPSHSQLISMPTGTGKTITFLSAIRSKNKKCLILVHREELLEQTYDKAKLCGFEEKEISIIRAGKKDSLKNLTIAMVQTLIRNLDKYDANELEMMVIDEAHHSTAQSYKSIISHFRIFEDKKMLLGFTATPLRGDGKALADIYLSHSFKMTLSEATQNGYICPVHGMRVDIERSLENIDSSQGDYDISQLDKIINCDAVNKIIVDRCEFLQKTPSIIFCTSVDHAKALSSLLRKKKRAAISISYLNSKKYIERVYKMLKSGRIDFITNAIKLSEGFDYPPIQSIILARPTRSPVLYKQMIGRGLRKYEGKYDCFVLEFCGNDPKMICWEDIDENCTFQSTSIKEKKSRENAIEFYKGKFASCNIKILDVRTSPFNFYECKIRRIIKYKNLFRYIPFQYGFAIFEFKKTLLKYGSYFNNYASQFFWDEEYKSFHAFGEIDYPFYYDENGRTIKELEQMCEWYALKQKNFGKWYPSEEEPMNIKQKRFLPNEKTSARKAEMMIEDNSIKKIIDKYWINNHPKGGIMSL